MIEAALRECGGRVYGPSGAAARLGIPRIHPGIEDQVIEDQQASPQGTRSPERQLADLRAGGPTHHWRESLCAARQFDDVRQFKTSSTCLLSVSLRLAFDLLFYIARNEIAENSQEVERGNDLHPERPDRQRQHCRIGSAHRRGKEGSPHRSRPQRHDIDRSGRHQFSRSVRDGRHCAAELRSIRPRVDHGTKRVEASACWLDQRKTRTIRTHKGECYDYFRFDRVQSEIPGSARRRGEDCTGGLRRLDPGRNGHRKRSDCESHS